MEAQEIRRKLEEAIKIDDCTVRTYLKIETEKVSCTIAIMGDPEEAEEHKKELIESLVQVLS